MNKLNYWIIILHLILSGCNEDYKVTPGSYVGNLYTIDNQEIPFDLDVLKDGSVQIFNHKEIVNMENILYTKDSFLIKSPVFEGYIKAKKTSFGLEGYFINNSLDRKIEFKANPGHQRFKLKNDSKNYNFSGKWKVVFNPEKLEEYNAIGIFDQKNSKISGTFRTTTGDYGFMEGVSDGDLIKLSTFNGARSYLFKGEVEENIISGYFYRGNYNKTPFIANKDENYELPDPNNLTLLNNQYNNFKFSFEDTAGELVSYNDSKFKDKVLVVQIMGTWCPNCLDETTFLSEFISKNNYKDLEFVSLAFEYVKTKDRAITNINKLKARFNIKYPILLAQFGTSNKVEAQKRIPSLQQVVSYPTLIFIDKKKNVRRIHTGFNGPATGEKYENFKREFKELILKLLAED